MTAPSTQLFGPITAENLGDFLLLTDSEFNAYNAEIKSQPGNIAAALATWDKTQVEAYSKMNIPHLVCMLVGELPLDEGVKIMLWFSQIDPKMFDSDWMLGNVLQEISEKLTGIENDLERFRKFASLIDTFKAFICFSGWYGLCGLRYELLGEGFPGDLLRQLDLDDLIRDEEKSSFNEENWQQFKSMMEHLLAAALQ